MPAGNAGNLLEGESPLEPVRVAREAMPDGARHQAMQTIRPPGGTGSRGLSPSRRHRLEGTLALQEAPPSSL